MVIFTFYLILVGVGVGVLSGALGLGGGILMVPAFLALVPNMDPHTAKGTSLFVVIFVAIFNALRLNHRLTPNTRLLALLLSVGATVGSYFGAWATTLLPAKGVIALYLALVAFVALRTFVMREPAVEKVVPLREHIRYPLISIGIGMVAGAVGGATGTGGGLLMVPMTLLLQLCPNTQVVGMSNWAMFVTALAGSVAHLRATPVLEGRWICGHVDLAIVPAVFVGAQIGSWLGVRINAWMTLRVRRWILGTLLSLVSLQLAFRLWH